MRGSGVKGFRLYARLLKYDCSLGFAGNLPLYLISIAAFIALSLLFISALDALAATPIPIGQTDGGAAGSFISLITYYFKGRQYYSPDLNVPFVLPFDWIMIQILVAMLVGFYPVRDFQGYASQVLIRAQGRWYWWLAKATWVILTVTLFYLIAFIAALAVSVIFGWELSATSSTADTIISNVSLRGLPATQIALILLIPILLSIALSLVQLVLSFTIGPFFGFLALMAYYAVSIYLNTGFLIGADSMILRNAAPSGTGMGQMSIVAVCILLTVAATAIGGALFVRRDLINQGAT